MIFNIFEKVSIFCGVHIFKAFREISHVKGIHTSLGIWVSWEGTGGIHKTRQPYWKGIHISRGYTYHGDTHITGIHISRGYTYHGDTHITGIHISRGYTYHGDTHITVTV